MPSRTSRARSWKADNGAPDATNRAAGGIGGHVGLHIVDAASVGITSGWTCTAVDEDGICSSWNKFKPVKLCFWYANSPGAKGTAGKWLLNTAYPSLNADCS